MMSDQTPTGAADTEGRGATSTPPSGTETSTDTSTDTTTGSETEGRGATGEPTDEG